MDGVTLGLMVTDALRKQAEQAMRSKPVSRPHVVLASAPASTLLPSISEIQKSFPPQVVSCLGAYHSNRNLTETEWGMHTHCCLLLLHFRVDSQPKECLRDNEITLAPMGGPQGPLPSLTGSCFVSTGLLSNLEVCA